MPKKTTTTRRRAPATCEHCGAPFLARLDSIASGRGRFCSRTCALSGRARPLQERFEDALIRDINEQGCWAFGDNRNVDSGRPHTSIKRKTLTWAHIAFELYREPVPDGSWVLHNCPGGENGWCVNPDHLYVGDHVQNARDKIANGRASWVTKPENIRRGEKHPSAKLSTAQVDEIRLRYAIGGWTFAGLGREYGVGGNAIRRIVRYQNRKAG